MEIPQIIRFNGVDYKLMGAGKYYLSQSNTNAGRKHAKGLHVAIWEYHNKRKVPKGYCIHHKDGNTFNNDISNLECMPISEHSSKHAKKSFNNEEYRRKNKADLLKASEKAKEWHKSKDGREWHSKHAQQMDYSPRFECICKQCGKTFLASHHDAMFCSDNCGAKYRTKILQYDGICKECGKPFKFGKPKPSAPDRMFCCRRCAIVYSYKQRGKKKD